MVDILKRITIVLLTAVLLVGALPVGVGAQNRNGTVSIQTADADGEAEAASEGDILRNRDNAYSTGWGFEYMMLLFAGSWALVLQMSEAYGTKSTNSRKIFEYFHEMVLTEK